MVTDPISDFLVRIHNASMVGKESVTVPSSKMVRSLATLLVREGYIADADKNTKNLSVTLSYKNGRPAINGVKRISKLSRRIYMGVSDLKPVKRGHGLLVLSTPAGVVTGKEAREKRVGGEALFEIW
ncbi:MAG: 30S ribosomal protein S8 [Patescibacteria group bacterium]